jgi:DNA polymerase-3 subunit epsilon
MWEAAVDNLRLDRPIAFIDVETTGLNVSQDRIVELTILKMHPDGTEELESARLNPSMPIPADATAVHGITDQDVENEPVFRQYAKSLLAFLDNCDLGGFGLTRFDLPILEAEFRRAGLELSRRGRQILDALIIYHRLEPRDLTAAYKKYCGKELANAHASGSDVRAAADDLDAQLGSHPELPRDVVGLHEFCNPIATNAVDSEGKFLWSEGEVVFSFGKYNGKRLKTIADEDPEYLEWLASADFAPEVRDLVARALDGDFPEPVESN